MRDLVPEDGEGRGEDRAKSRSAFLIPIWRPGGRLWFRVAQNLLGSGKRAEPQQWGRVLDRSV